jgi:hypothetical protein
MCLPIFYLYRRRFAGPKTEQYIFVPVMAAAPPNDGGYAGGGGSNGRGGTRGGSDAGLLKVQCPQTVPPWQCPGFEGQCLMVIPISGPPSPPPQPTPPTADAAGALTLYLGANQMWGLREYNRSRCTFDKSDSSSNNHPGNESNFKKSNTTRMKEREEKCVPFQGDTTFPRRLGIGGITVSPTNSSALVGATFTAEMHVATAEVRASLVASPSDHYLTIHVVLDPDENIALTTITSDPPMEVAITSWARCAFSDRKLHSRMPLVRMPARFKLEASMRLTNGIPLGCPLFLPVHTVNCVQTLKANCLRSQAHKCWCHYLQRC